MNEREGLGMRGAGPVHAAAWCMLLAVFLATDISSVQAQQPEEDSTQRRTLTVTPRLNSAGHFPFTGALLNRNANADLTIFYQRRKNGVFIFQSVDLEDRRSYVNYLQPGVFRKFELGKTLQLGLFAGYVFSQTEWFSDEYSDFFAAPVVYWAIRPHLRLESTSLFFDMRQSLKLANRFLVSYSVAGFRLDGYLWHRVVFDTNVHALSASLALLLPKAPITSKVWLQSSISFFGYLTRARPEFARKNGLLFSVSIPMDL